MLNTARTAIGIKPTLLNFVNKIPGKIAKKDIKEKETINWDMLDGTN